MTTNTLSLPFYSLALRIDTHEHLPWEEICARFPDRWVVLVEFDRADESDFNFTAKTLSHHATRREASPFVKAAHARYYGVGCFWTGEIRCPSPRLSGP
jgi:hypothetical protein